jgi:hypothetical protein
MPLLKGEINLTKPISALVYLQLKVLKQIERPEYERTYHKGENCEQLLVGLYKIQE